VVTTKSKKKEATTATIQLDVLLDACIKLAGAACALIRTGGLRLRV
jgi:hypothetical protein